VPTTFKPNQAGIKQLFGGGPVGRHIAALGQRTLKGAQARIDDDSGRLKRSGRTTFQVTPTGCVSKVQFLAPYALYYHEGTKPHDIGSPVLIKDVGWRYIGRSPSGKGKMHPGYEGNPFLVDALEDEVKRG
jgi:hypothetical protein